MNEQMDKLVDTMEEQTTSPAGEQPPVSNGTGEDIPESLKRKPVVLDAEAGNYSSEEVFGK